MNAVLQSTRLLSLGLVVLNLMLVSCGREGTGPASPSASYESAQAEARRGRIKEAFDLAGRAFDAWKEQPSSEWHWRFKLLKAEYLLLLAPPQEATALLGSSPPATPGFRPIEARRRMLLGQAEYRAAHFPDARRLLDEAAQMAAALDEPGLMAEIELRRGPVLSELGDAEGVERSAQNALEQARRSGNRFLEANALGNLGYLRQDSSRFDEAIVWFERALALLERSQDARFHAKTTGNLGWCYYNLGQEEKALKLLGDAEATAAQMADLWDRQIWLGDIGDIHSSRREFDAAQNYFRQALEFARKLKDLRWMSVWLNNLADSAIEASDFDAAERYDREALDLAREFENPWAIMNSARIAIGRQRFAEAEATLKALVSSGLKKENPAVLWEAHASLAQLYGTTLRPREAEAEYQQAIEAVEDVRAKLLRDEWKFPFQAHFMQFYRDYVDFLMERGNVERALEVAEWSRARVLAEKLGLKTERLGGGSGKGFRGQARAMSAVLLSYWLAPKRSFLWVTTPAATSSYVLPGAPVLEREVEAYSAALLELRDPLETLHPSGRRLYEMLVRPAASLIPHGSNVILVADGALHKLNFESLLVDSSQPHYWIDDVTLALAPSLRVLLSGDGGQTRGNRPVLIIGDPLPAVEEFPALPNAGREIEGIRQTFDRSLETVLTRADATPAAYRSADARRFGFIHFSAHASVNRESPLDSAVILSPKGDTYKLYARELLAVPLQAELVTISACRSAGANTYSGEGLVGFSWALLQAGARNVIAGLWDVNDRSTADLMVHLYGNLDGSRRPAAALRSAKLDLLKSSGPYHKPYYWAPFQLYSRANPF